MQKSTPNKEQKEANSMCNSIELKRLASHLDLCCQKRETITYLEAADAIAVPAPQRIHKITQLLEALMQHDHSLGQAIRAALVVSRAKTGLPREGFFLKAQTLGLMSDMNQREFHQWCLNRLFDA